MNIRFCGICACLAALWLLAQGCDAMTAKAPSKQPEQKSAAEQTAPAEQPAPMKSEVDPSIPRMEVTLEPEVAKAGDSILLQEHIKKGDIWTPPRYYHKVTHMKTAVIQKLGDEGGQPKVENLMDADWRALWQSAEAVAASVPEGDYKWDFGDEAFTIKIAKDGKVKTYWIGVTAEGPVMPDRLLQLWGKLVGLDPK